MSMEKDSTKTLRRWRATIKANGTPALWETSSGCSCVTSRRQNTPDLLRKHPFDCQRYYELCNIFSVYTKMRLFKSQKTRGDRAKLFINLNSAHPN